MQTCAKQGLRLYWWVALLIPQTRNNLLTFYSQSETLDTLLYLSSLTNSSACWRKPSPAQTGDCSRKPWRPLRKPRTQGPSLHKHPTHTGEPLSCLASQQHSFVLYAVLTAQQNEHTAMTVVLLWRGGWESHRMQLNVLSMWTAQKSQWEWRSESETTRALHRHLGVADLQQVMWSLVTFPMEPESECGHTQMWIALQYYFFFQEPMGLKGEGNTAR